ncbi:MAG: Maf family protein [Phycisphaerales bacterium]|nr:Maf family protein [Phycisphaerales bacterium]
MTPTPSPHPPRLLLASRSPRRLLLLREAGYEVDAIDTAIDDGELRPGRVTIAQWTAALAHLKARAALHAHDESSNRGMFLPAHALIIGSDTVVEMDDRLIGQPRDADDARRIILDLADREHDVITGVSLIHVATGCETLFFDVARVTVGPIPPNSIDEYVATGQWRGKAGAYNLSERLAAGWPIQYQGDPATIMGLPMKRLTRCLANRWNITPRTMSKDAASS